MRSPPSSWALATSNSVGNVGHGWWLARSAGGCLPIARVVTRRGLVPVRGAEAVRAGVAAAEDDHVLSGGVDLVLHRLPRHHAVGRDEVVHREVHALELAARDRQVTRDGGAGGDHHGVVPAAQLLPGHVGTDGDAGPEAGAFGLHLLQPAVHVLFFHLEIGDAVTQEPADLVVALVDGDGVADAGQLLRDGEPGGAGTDDGDRLVAEAGRRQRVDPAVLERLVHDRDLNLLDCHGRLVDAQHAGRLARGRAEPPGELREVVGGVQPLHRFLALVPPDQVIPLGNQVAQRAALVAERDAAVHAAAGLGLEDSLFLGLIDFLPVHDADRNRTAGLGFALTYFQKSAWISHRSPPEFETKLLRRSGSRPSSWRQDGSAVPPRSRAAAPW